MAFWGRHDWLSDSLNKSVVSDFDQSKVDEASYRLSIGGEVYLPDSDGASISKLGDGESFFIAAGQFAFILTEEVVNIPLSKIGFISVRAGIKFHGLVNVSGFHVDPGYDGQLVFAVFNSGPTRIHLKRGQDIFSLWLSDLKTPNEEDDKPKKGYDSLDTALLNKIDGNHLTAYQVSSNIEEVRALAKKNEDDLRRIKFLSWTVAFVLSLVLIPIARPILTNIYQSFQASNSETSVPETSIPEGALIPSAKSVPQTNNSVQTNQNETIK